MPMREVWSKCLAILKAKINQNTFDIWLKPLKLVSINGGLLELEVPNKFFKDWISENYQSAIQQALL
jgi:chromosomal replication initiator protein